MNSKVKKFSHQTKNQHSQDGNNTSKHFDKKKYRDKKYNKKFQVQQWELRKKKAALRDLVKDLKKDEKLPKTQKEELINSFNQKKKTVSSKKSAFEAASLRGLKKKEEEEAKKAEFLKQKQEKKEALKKYKLKRIENFKKLSKTNKLGQPVMKGRLEILLEKIKRSS